MCLPSSIKITSMLLHLDFKNGLWGSNSGPHACMEHTLSNKLAPQDPVLFSQFFSQITSFLWVSVLSVNEKLILFTWHARIILDI